MKKISLKNLNLKEVDQLSREQLKNVLGGNSGSGNSGSGDTVVIPCKCENGSTIYTICDSTEECTEACWYACG